MSYRSDNDDSHNPWYSGPRPKETTIEDDLRAENARLKAELEALRPKPVIQAFVHSFLGPHVSSSKHMIRGLIKLYYDDSTGIIVSAEVLSDK